MSARLTREMLDEVKRAFSAAMSGLPLSSTETWPKTASRANGDGVANNYRARAEKAMEQARQLLERAGDDLQKREATNVLYMLCESLEQYQNKGTFQR